MQIYDTVKFWHRRYKVLCSIQCTYTWYLLQNFETEENIECQKIQAKLAANGVNVKAETLERYVSYSLFIM
jgi:hypothetical protein